MCCIIATAQFMDGQFSDLKHLCLYPWTHFNCFIKPVFVCQIMLISYKGILIIPGYEFLLSHVILLTGTSLLVIPFSSRLRCYRQAATLFLAIVAT